ncbi:MAG: ATP-binding protein [Bacteriovoracaceae bacterium]|nr:ATP-binding protein [Bacteriovoracaceae bacterium]
MAKLNVFNPNATVAPGLFAGRVQLVTSVINKLTQVKMGLSSSFIFSGERGIGKTALAKFIRYLATHNDKSFGELNFLTSYYAVEKGQSFEYVLQTSLNSLTDQLPENVLDRLSKRVGNIFKGGKFSIGAFGGNVDVDLGKNESLLKDQHIKDIAVSIFTNIIRGLEESKDNHSGILIIIDEVHNLGDLQGIAMILRNIATTLDINELGKVSFLIIGYTDAIELFFDGDQSARRHFDHYELGCLTTEDSKEILRKGFAGAQVKIEESIISLAASYSGGYPHAIQVIGHNILECDSDEIIDEKDLSLGLSKTALELQKKDFLNFYKFGKKPTTKEALLDILAIVGKMTRQELSKISEDKNLYRTINDLKKIGAIKEDVENGQVYLSSMLLAVAIIFHIAPKIKNDGYLKETMSERNKSLYSAIGENFTEALTQNKSL